jgi:hypothetical protein
MKNQKVILSLPNDDLELYSLILSLYLDCDFIIDQR